MASAPSTDATCFSRTWTLARRGGPGLSEAEGVGEGASPDGFPPDGLGEVDGVALGLPPEQATATRRAMASPNPRNLRMRPE